MKEKNKGKFNHEFFNEIDSESKSYWFGFIMADGHIIDNVKYGALQLGIHLSDVDLNHLKKFHKEINSNNNINFGKKNDIKSNHSSDMLCNDLIKMGCVPRKSLILTYPKNISNELTPHFIRGYFDGYGSTCIHKGRLFLDFLGTKEFLEGLNKELPIQRNVRVKKDNLFILQISDINGCKILYDYMYKNATIFLERKKENIEKWLKIPKYGSGNYSHEKQKKET